MIWLFTCLFALASAFAPTATRCPTLCAKAAPTEDAEEAQVETKNAVACPRSCLSYKHVLGSSFCGSASLSLSLYLSLSLGEEAGYPHQERSPGRGTLLKVVGEQQVASQQWARGRVIGFSDLNFLRVVETLSDTGEIDSSNDAHAPWHTKNTIDRPNRDGNGRERADAAASRPNTLVRPKKLRSIPKDRGGQKKMDERERERDS